MSAEVRIVLTTAPDPDTARELARGLVEERLAACCNLLGNVTSVYRWEGRVEQAAEVLLVVKTAAARLPELQAALLARHPYAVPELVVLAPEELEPRYLAWLLEATAPGRPAAAPTDPPRPDPGREG